MPKFLTLFWIATLIAFSMGAEVDAALSLRENIQRAEPGDFIVAIQNKNYTLLHIYDKTSDMLTIEEITIPIGRMPSIRSWKEWVQQGAPHSTSWILYRINRRTGDIPEGFSVSQNSWLDMSKGDTFLPTLLNLRFTPVPLSERRKIGPPPTHGSPDQRTYWQPKMMVNNQQIPGVTFDTWRTYWPQDGSMLSEKTIDIYLPSDQVAYPSYFPYWLEIRGSVAGKATIHVIDSGSQLVSPAAPIPKKT